MKKSLSMIIFTSLFFVLAIIASSTKVFADMDAPAIQPYEAVVSNVNGASYYIAYPDFVEAGKLNYGDKIEITYEEVLQDGKLYGNYYDENNNYGYYVRISDLQVVDTEKDFSKNISLSNSKHIEILAKDGVEMYKGPAYAYSKLGVTIPKGETLKGYFNQDIYEPWYYVEYKNTSGFICILKGAVGFEKESNKKLLTPRKISIYDNTDTFDKKDVIGTIPANTYITEYKEVDTWSRAYYVTYNGISGYISYYDIAFEPYEELSSYKVNYKNAKIYKEGSINSEVLLDNIPEGTELKSEFEQDIRVWGWFYTTYKDISGWVLLCEDEESYEEYLEDIQNEEIDEEDNILENTIVDDKENVVKNGKEEVRENKEIYSQNNMRLQIILICILVAVTVSITSLVTIILINHKKDKNKKD